MTEVLVVYYSRGGATAELARQACRGIESVTGVSARLRTVPPLAALSERPARPVPESGPAAIPRRVVTWGVRVNPSRIIDGRTRRLTIPGCRPT